MLVFKNNEERCIRIYAVNGINTTARFTVCDGGSFFMYNDIRYEPIQAVNYSSNARQVSTIMLLSSPIDVLQFLADSMYSAWYPRLHYGLTVIARNTDTELVEFLDVLFTPEDNKLSYTITPMLSEIVDIDQPDYFDTNMSGDYDAILTLIDACYDVTKLSTLVLAKMHAHFDECPPAILTITEDNFSTDKLKAITSEEHVTIIKAVK